MKRVLFVLLLLCALLLTACSGEGAAHESTAPEIPETTAPCEHPNLSVTRVSSTCEEDGYIERICADCGYHNTTILAPSHFYENNYDIETGRDISTCIACGVSGYLLGVGECIEFSGYFEGDAAFTVKAAFGEGLVDFWIDDELIETVSCGGEDVSLSAKMSADTAHFFTFDNVGESDILIETQGMEGKLNRKDAVLVEVQPVQSDMYNSVNIYVQTSDPSGDYYIRYRMQYDYSDARNNYTFSSGSNVSNYRIKTAQLVKIESFDGKSVVATDLLEVLQSGEISLAVTQRNVDRSTLSSIALSVLGNGTQAMDCVGGLHGDERLQHAALYADGEEIEIFGQREWAVYPCTYVNFDQTTTVYAWGTSTKESFGREMLLHSQNFIFDSNGMRDRKAARWLDDGYEIGIFYFQMFTVRRSVGGKMVCEQLEAFDGDGRSLGSATVPTSLTSDRSYLSNLKNREMRYSSATSGVSAKASFKILNDSVVVDRMYVLARALQGDNKLYVSFRSAKNGSFPKKDEVFEIEAYYNIDYVDPASAE